MTRWLGAAIAAGLMCGAASADLRRLEVPVTAGWQHDATGLVLTPQLAGLSRVKVEDFGTEEVDLAITYGNAEHTIGSVYVFHPGLDNVPVWFDRSQTAILTRSDYGSTVGNAEPRAFAVTPGTVNDSLRITYALTGGKVTATALAMVPLGDWLVAVRLSSPTMSAEALDQTMSTMLRDIRWPANRASGPEARPVVACTAQLAFGKAKILKPDMTQVLMNSLLSSVVAKDPAEKAPAAPIFCRDGAASDQGWALYRPDGATDRYVIALNDSGRAVGVQPALALKHDPSYSTCSISRPRRRFPTYRRCPLRNWHSKLSPRSRRSARPRLAATARKPR
jgi:hypothetical protein